MKNDQRDAAMNLYFQTVLTKTEIAAKVGVTRKTVLFWSQQGNWDKIRMSARTMPALVAEKCYHLIDQYTRSLLTEGAATSTLQLKHAQTIHLLASTIKKLKNRSTVNESMEMFNFFLDGLSRRDPALSHQVAPYIEEYITIREHAETNDFLTDEFNKDGLIPYPDKAMQEKDHDEKDNARLVHDFEIFLNTMQENDIPGNRQTIESNQSPNPLNQAA
jgi:hypothetical protein